MKRREIRTLYHQYPELLSRALAIEDRARPHWIGKPPALPVEVPRKKALASSNERSELLTANYQGRKTYVRTADARLRAAGQVMRVK